MAKAVKSLPKTSAKKTVKPAATKKKPVPATKKTAVASGKTAVKKTAPRKTIGKTAVTITPKKTSKKPAAKPPSKDMTRYRCKLCGYIYSPLRGEPHNGITEGTAFDDLPDTYVCPVCGQRGKGRIGKWGFEAWRPTRYLCSLCSYIYDEKRGEPHRGIKPGTKFEDLPDDYSCPVCAMDPNIRVRFGKVFKSGFEPLNL
jgi:rubredoxin